MIRQFTSKTQQLGQEGEDQAVLFLMKQGFTVLERNVNNRHGEIDIVAKKQQTHHFFEVKAGKQGSWFNPADNLTKEKLWKFHRAVEYYCARHSFSGAGKYEKIKDYKIQGIIVLLPKNNSKQATVEIIELS